MKKTLITTVFILMLIGAAPTNSNAQDSFIGSVKLFAGNFTPRGWIKCEGQLLLISESNYSPLYHLIGTTYGGDGKTTFALPDLRGRIPVGAGTGPRISQGVNRVGFKKGFETVTLTINQLTSHEHHLYNVSEISIETPVENNNNHYESKKVLSPVANRTTSVTTTTTGDSQVINITPPSLGMSYIICLSGVYPAEK